MKINSNKYHHLIKELKRFQNQGDEINLEEFEIWKKNVINELSGNYKIRFSNLEFYTIYEESENSSNDDDLPF